FIASTIFSEENDLFHAYIAISPGMHYLDRQILNDAESMIQENASFHNFYYCTYGTVGHLEAYFDPQVNFLDSLFRAHPNETIHWGKKELPGKTHWSVVAISLAEGLVEMNRAYQVDQYLVEEFSRNEGLSLAEQIEAYYTQQSDRLGYTVPLQAPSLRYYGGEMQEVANNNRALELYDLSLSLDQNEVRTYFGKADALIQLERLSEAMIVYEEAIEVLELNESQLDPDRKNRYTASLQESITRLREQMD
ncbi:MAG: hypothetical protein AAFY91_04090, partial [Bacteroidota bacterium]